jgi:hypothetical protein
MDSGGQIAIDNRRERWLLQRALLNPIVRRSEPRDICSDQQAARDENSSCFGKSTDAVAPLGEVIKRTKEENHVDSRVCQMKASRITHFGACQRRLGSSRQRPRSRHVQRNRNPGFRKRSWR